VGRYLVGDFVAFCFAVVAVGLIYQKKKKKSSCCSTSNRNYSCMLQVLFYSYVSLVLFMGFCM
jgi:hypothetical protein